MKNFMQDFKKFITKGNVLDLAVAVIIGGAFGKIISSLVNHILMPFISLIIGGKSFEDIKTIIQPANEALGTAESAIYWGLFIQNVVDFVIIAFVVFMIIRIFARMNQIADRVREKRNEEALKAEAKEKELKALADSQIPKQPTIEALLIEIKDLLAKQIST